VDDIIRFRSLYEEDHGHIVEFQLEGLRRRLSDRRIELKVTDAAMALLARRGFDPAFGARPLKRVIQKDLGDRLALALLEGTFGDGDTVTVDADGDDLTVS
jgi:ATP-dependent Clp protease ATP-binding subunit ClpB